MEVKVADCPLGAKCEEAKLEAGRQVMYRCPWYVMVSGKDMNTGKEVNEWGCAIAWMPTLMINTANESRKGVAATNSFRNEMVTQGAQTQHTLLAVAQLQNQPHPHPQRHPHPHGGLDPTGLLTDVDSQQSLENKG